MASHEMWGNLLCPGTPQPFCGDITGRDRGQPHFLTGVLHLLKSMSVKDALQCGDTYLFNY